VENSGPQNVFSNPEHLLYAFTHSVFAPLGTGLPDGIFSSQKLQFRYFLEGLGVENVAVFCGIRCIFCHLV
jgi:hypothetical protein